jgi:hypothetical protein
MSVIAHEHPDKPTTAECYGTEMSDVLWELIMRCWAADPDARPNMNDVNYTLEKLIVRVGLFDSYGAWQTDKYSVICHPVQYCDS